MAPPDILGFDIPVAVFSGAATLWAGKLAMNDKRYAMRHTLTMLSGLSFFIATLLELLAADQMGFPFDLDSSYYIMNSVAVLFAMIARYLLWCILFEVVRGTSKTSEDSQLSTIPKTAYGWSALMSILMLVYVILVLVTGSFAAIVMYYIGTYGIVMMNILQLVLSSRPGYSLAINPFRGSFRIFLLLLSLVSLGQIFGNVSFYVLEMGGFMALTILQYVFGSLLASMALVFVCTCSSKWVSFSDHDRLNQVGDDEAQQPMGTYNPDDVYTSNKTAADDVGRF
ncbi:hypothetical protein O0I10_000151 [Lichtheimia ornata]|uniref:Chitin synthase export chaperone n=1 Tax=Lichtheimia ornata TaxID=688661 RepID=A0AAD7Y518_9FUNG|nr:uncharacterized protein O0I10_000151 [Lichtheimia ornata]KAJ8663876.1 hypothetical protein O0I10_000151 [Lichtheimia ornata]